VQPIFHAYLGYEFTHIRGIEANPARISRVRFTHILGRLRVHTIDKQILSGVPVGPCNEIPYHEACSRPANRGKRTQIVELLAALDLCRGRGPPPAAGKVESVCLKREFFGERESMTGTEEFRPVSVRFSIEDKRP
jgi:hypothetical protein